MRPTVHAAVLALALPSAACGPGIPGGPTMDNHVNAETAAPAGPDAASNDILARDAQTNRARVKHILIGWRKPGHGDQDPRAAARTQEQALALARATLARVRAGEAIEPLMAELSEDPGSNTTGEAYEATPDAGLVFPFKRLALRLKVGEAGLVESEFGYHVMKRVE